jgi:hypothetical protein
VEYFHGFTYDFRTYQSQSFSRRKRLYQSCSSKGLNPITHGLGRWIRNNAGLWAENGGGVRDSYEDIKRIGLDKIEKLLVNHGYDNMLAGFKDNGVEGNDSDDLCHPDNISFVIVQLYHLYLNNSWIYV